MPVRRETLMMPNEVIAKVNNLPVVSQAAIKLVTLLDQPAISNGDIVTVLKYDNVLTAKLLRACNSPFFGFEEATNTQPFGQASFYEGQSLGNMVMEYVFTFPLTSVEQTIVINSGALPVPTGVSVSVNQL